MLTQLNCCDNIVNCISMVKIGVLSLFLAKYWTDLENP